MNGRSFPSAILAFRFLLNRPLPDSLLADCPNTVSRTDDARNTGVVAGVIEDPACYHFGRGGAGRDTAWGDAKRAGLPDLPVHAAILQVYGRKRLHDVFTRSVEQVVSKTISQLTTDRHWRTKCTQRIFDGDCRHSA